VHFEGLVVRSLTDKSRGCHLHTTAATQFPYKTLGALVCRETTSDCIDLCGGSVSELRVGYEFIPLGRSPIPKLQSPFLAIPTRGATIHILYSREKRIGQKYIQFPGFHYSKEKLNGRMVWN
jgi:hypothetical protein